ncbi:MAG: ribosome biogenesis GTP-binding protein YihA/YsxC [Eubacteriales bacterium]|nr:ribosome biogenesis GTP-binding protein YihA/YsxC [Eubacteriales bacterium]
MYQIKKANLYKSIGRIDQYEEIGLPEIAMVGRSNVGKSSLINMICNNRKLSYVGATPGKTRLINEYRVNDELLLVDLPGYGYAAASRNAIRAWNALIEQYLQKTTALCEVFHIVDVRHEPTPDDIQMVAYMVYHNIPFCHIASKCDKLSRSAVNKQIGILAEKLQVPPSSILPVSAQTGQGKEALLDRLESVLIRFDTAKKNLGS